ncbi:MAG: penicillin-binding transpeptidase domain-containing protein [Luteolibacter sp.]|jgi:penicillin-binding protein 2|nr:penicillin-binding transpeptidase domain-containing protein [Luteolibacter sp.]
MEPGYRLRIYLLTALVLVGFGVLLNRLHEFQIERRSEFLNQVPGNRTVTVREPGIRGEITDRNGITLARNLRKYEVSFNLDEIREAYLAQHEEDPIIERLTKEQGITRKRSEKDIVTIVNEWTITRLRKLDLARNYNATALRTHYLTHGGLIPFSYRADLSYDEFSRFAEHNLELPGVYLTMRPQRKYPYGSLASHVIGYLKQWEKGDIPEGDARKFNHYIGDEKGIAGVEASMDAILRGPEGRKTIVRNEKGRTIRMSDYIKPGIGAKVQLTIDARAQYLLENVLRHAGRAAGVIMDVNTGEVLAMASVPDYDPNAFIPSIEPQRWKSYNENKLLSPLTNRTISAYAPGSTMKIPTAISGALQGMAARSFSCDGYVTYGNHPVGCWLWNKSKGSHGSLTLPKAIQQSCNPYFNKLANTIGWRAMVDGCQMVGIGKRTGIELPAEKPGILPGSRAWRSANPGAVMTPVLTAFTSIGQGDTLATPLQLCAMIASVANGGKYYQPRIVRKAVSEEGRILVENKPKLVVDLIEAGIKPQDFQLIRKGMWMAVNVPGGTAGKVKMPGIEVAAKTGTAQTTEDGQKSNNSWVISFAPFENPKYAVCVLVQNAGSGGAVCGPLVHLIYQGLFGSDEGVKLPLKPQTEYAGNTERIEAIVLPEKPATTPETAETVETAAASGDEEDLGETGDEIGEITPDPARLPADNSMTPIPTLTPEIDAEGTVVPKAIPVPEP